MMHLTGKQVNANAIWLAFLRYSVSLLCLLHFLAIQPDFDALFSASGFVPPDIMNAGKPAFMPTIYGFYNLINPITGCSYTTALTIIRIAYPVCLILLCAGLFTRVFAFASLALQLTIISSISFYNYGVDVFTTICLFYCFVFPVGKVHSLDNKLFKQRRPLQNHTKYLALLQAHICIAYFFSGFEKMLGHTWRNGEAIWKMIHGYNSTSFINLDGFYNTPLFMVIAWGTIILEMLYPLFINLQKTRRVWLYGIILFHISIAVFIGLYFFSAIMIIINLACYYAPFIKTVPAAEKDAALSNTKTYGTALAAVA